MFFNSEIYTCIHLSKFEHASSPSTGLNFLKTFTKTFTYTKTFTWWFFGNAYTVFSRKYQNMPSQREDLLDDFLVIHILCSQENIKTWWWWWIVFVVWLTDERRLALFLGGTIVRDPHHRKSPTCREQGFNLCRTWVQA